MDPGLAFSALPLPPVVGETAVVVVGGFLPQALPIAALGPASRAALAQLDGVPVDQRVDLLLGAGRDAQALHLASRVAAPLPARLELVLARWAAEEQARLGLPQPLGGVVVLGADGPGPWRQSAEALASVRRELAVLPWPRWAGPVVVVLGDLPLAGLPPGDTSLVRPALPLVRIANPGPRPALAITERLARLALDSCAPPPGGWPAWLRRGFPAALAGYLDGSLPPAEVLARRRSAAGPVAIADALVASGEPGDLAVPLAAPWLSAALRRRLPSLMDSLRAGVPVSSALRLAGGPGADDLAGAPGRP